MHTFMGCSTEMSVMDVAAMQGAFGGHHTAALTEELAENTTTVQATVELVVTVRMVLVALQAGVLACKVCTNTPFLRVLCHAELLHTSTVAAVKSKAGMKN